MTNIKNVISVPLRLIGSYPAAFVLIATLAGIVGLAALWCYRRTVEATQRVVTFIDPLKGGEV
jgi:hypothetical protein